MSHPTIALTEYFSYWVLGEDGNRIKNPKANKNTGLILDVKSYDKNPEAAKEAIKLYADAALEATKKLHQAMPIGVIALVPGHRAGTHSKILGVLAKFLAARLKISADPELLVRWRDIDKLATGGDRSIHVQCGSLRVSGPSLDGANVLLIDDVCTSGNSLNACDSLLKQHGASQVFSIVLGKTTY